MVCIGIGCILGSGMLLLGVVLYCMDIDSMVYGVPSVVDS